MKRGRLFFIGLVTAIVTIISLNVFVGRSYGGYNRWRHHGYCAERYRDDDKNNKQQHQQQPADSSTRNY